MPDYGDDTGSSTRTVGGSTLAVRELRVPGSYVFTPRLHHDDRGIVLVPFHAPDFTEAVGHPPFRVEQTVHSRSRSGTVRGVHYTATPPGSAKYVFCPQGRALDFIVDLRVGSPTFGQWDSIILDDTHHQAVFLPVGVGHAFVALEDETLMSYLLSEVYSSEREFSLNALDPALGLPISEHLDPVLSHRDRTAPTLAEARAAGTLPQLADCLDTERPSWN